MYDNVFKLRTTPVAERNEIVEIYSLSTIPEFLRDAVHLENHKLWLDNEDGWKSAELGAAIAYEKSDRTLSGYNCWSIGKVGFDLVKIDGVFYKKPHIVFAMVIPDQKDTKPLWVRSCNLIYNHDGTATLKTPNGNVTGRVGIDLILCHGLHGKKEQGKPIASILARYDKDYTNYVICDDEDRDLCQLSELYPA